VIYASFQLLKHEWELTIGDAMADTS